MEFLIVDGLVLHDPASCTYQFIDLSTEKSGRNPLTGENYKDIIAQKRKLVCRWNAMPVKEASGLAKIMKMRGATVRVTYFDIADNDYATRLFTTGDFNADYLAGWTATRKLVGNITCDFIEV